MAVEKSSHTSIVIEHKRSIKPHVIVTAGGHFRSINLHLYTQRVEYHTELNWVPYICGGVLRKQLKLDDSFSHTIH